MIEHVACRGGVASLSRAAHLPLIGQAIASRLKCCYYETYNTHRIQSWSVCRAFRADRLDRSDSGHRIVSYILDIESRSAKSRIRGRPERLHAVRSSRKPARRCPRNSALQARLRRRALQDWFVMTLHDEVRRVLVSVRRRKHSALGWSSGPSCVAAEILRGATQ